MKIPAFRPQREPGFRLSMADIGILAAAVLAAIVLADSESCSALAPLPLHLFFTFFCFCNIFRIGTAAELSWGAVLVISWIAVIITGTEPYPAVLVTTVPAMLAVIVLSAIFGKYHGVGHSAVASMRDRLRRTMP